MEECEQDQDWPDDWLYISQEAELRCAIQEVMCKLQTKLNANSYNFNVMDIVGRYIGDCIVNPKS